MCSTGKFLKQLTFLLQGALDPNHMTSSSGSDSSSRESPERGTNQSETVIHIVRAPQQEPVTAAHTDTGTPTLVQFNVSDRQQRGCVWRVM